MVDFKLTPEQNELVKMVRKFALNEMRPIAAKCDKEERFPLEIYQKAFELGIITTAIPQEYGGAGLSVFEDCLILEELGAGCVGMTSSIAVNNLGTYPIILFGTEEQKRLFLTPITKELKFVSFALTEAEAGSDPAAIQTTAVREGDEYVINGTKRFITNSRYASLYTVFAMTDKSKKHRGLSAIVVPRETPGITIGKDEEKLGQRASNTAEVIFEDVCVPVANRLGNEGDGFKIAMTTLDKTRIGVGAIATGAARAAFEYAHDYALKRVQFGQPIANFQAIQFKFAEMAQLIDASRLLTWHAAWLADTGQKHTKESAIAKCFATDAAMRIALDAVQIFGGYGYIKEYPVEKIMRDVKLLQIYEGTNEIQRLVIARELMSGIS